MLGVNAIDHGDSASVAAMCTNVSLPLLQDTNAQKLWDRAAAEKDDVFILNAQRTVVRTFSAIDHPLTVAANADSLRSWVRAVVGPAVTSAR